MAEIADLMHANLLEVFNERDPERRREVIARTYTDDVQFVDHDGIVVGHDALHATAQGVLDRAPGFVFAPDGAVRVSDDLGYLPWTLGPEGQPPVVRGLDIALIRDGLIVKVYTLLMND
jgi:hypothetical protein